AYIAAAVQLALAGHAHAIVTCPVSKASIERSGTPFTGHTEWIARMANVRAPVMMFVGDRLKVALVTTHVALKKIPSMLTAEKIAHVIRLTTDALRNNFRLSSPRIALCGLNPHAGEEGLFGREEIDVIAPAVESARRSGYPCAGPYPADALFRRAVAGECDAVVAMYHDQALCAVKAVEPSAVNVTLGLPFVRTSVDHGTAFDIAGKGTAREESLIAAMNLAHRMVSATGELF
ncbi:MAG: 4-hydroxythreonine-4-phosphate dehydrogenase PdxA, partial [Planctomycetes bacterium RBG_16_59_8]